MNRIETDIMPGTASGGGGGQGRGRYLFAAETDRRRVGVDILIRLVVCGFALALLLFRESEILVPTGAVFLVYTLWPLLHMGDRMEFYENGILCCGELYPIGRQSRIAWVGSRHGFLTSTYLDISGCPRRIDVSFMKDARRLFNRAYGGEID